MRHLVAALLTLIPLTAFAHEEMDVTVEGGLTELSVGPRDCGRTLRFDWKSNMAQTQLCEPLLSWFTKDATCATRPNTTTDVIVDTVTGTDLPQNIGNFSVRVDALPVFGTPDAPLACPQPDLQTTWKLCTSYRTSAGTCIVENMVYAQNDHPVQITWDSRPPTAPKFGSLTPLDGAAAVTLTTDADTQVVRIEAKALGLPTRTVSFSARPFTGRITNLQNDTEYTVTAIGVDAAGNESPVSEEQVVRPVTTAGFWQNYKEAGGVEDGGCSHAGGGALAFLSLLSLARLVWRKRS